MRKITRAHLVKLDRDDPRRKWSTYDRNSLFRCPVCGSEFFIPCALEEWTYKINTKRGIIPLCRYNCMTQKQREMEAARYKPGARDRSIGKKMVVQLDATMWPIRYFDSIKEAADALHL